jgi:hypothetical protein
MILFNSSFDYEIEDYIKDNDGRFLICILKVNNEKILLANSFLFLSFASPFTLKVPIFKLTII